MIDLPLTIYVYLHQLKLISKLQNLNLKIVYFKNKILSLPLTTDNGTI